MSNFFLKQVLPQLQIVRGSVQVSSEHHKLVLQVTSCNEKVSNTQVVEMFDQVLPHTECGKLVSGVRPLVICVKRPTNALAVNLEDIAVSINGASLAVNGNVELECSYVPHYESLFASGTLDNGYGLISSVNRTFGEERHVLISLYFTLSPTGDNIIHRNSSNKET